MNTLTTAGRTGQGFTTHEAKGPGLLARLWSHLLEHGQRRAAAQVAHYVRTRGLWATGDIVTDAARLAAARGLRQRL